MCAQLQHLWKFIRLGLLAVVVAFALAPSLATAASPCDTATVFTLCAADFGQGDEIPNVHAFNAAGCVDTTGQGQNEPPLLSWVNGTTGFSPNPTQSYVLTIVDYDAPVSGGFHHWVVYNIPGSATMLDAATLAKATQGMNDFGSEAYGGPCPPQTGQTHHYIFTLYAVTIANIGGEGKTYDQVVQAMGVHHGINVNGATVLIGTFTNP